MLRLWFYRVFGWDLKKILFLLFVVLVAIVAYFYHKPYHKIGYEVHNSKPIYYSWMFIDLSELFDPETNWDNLSPNQLLILSSVYEKLFQAQSIWNIANNDTKKLLIKFTNEDLFLQDAPKEQYRKAVFSIKIVNPGHEQLKSIKQGERTLGIAYNHNQNNQFCDVWIDWTSAWQVYAHEFGHCMGFNHTEKGDPYSLMNEQVNYMQSLNITLKRILNMYLL